MKVNAFCSSSCVPKNVDTTQEVGGGGDGLVLGGKVPVAGRGARCCSSSVGFVSQR